MRKTDVFQLGLGAVLALTCASALDAALRSRAAAPAIERRSDLVARLDLTDLAIFTEARYTRHASQADLHSAFQDHPLAMEHFPNGSLVPARRPLLRP
jgi:hypothetical protein